MAAMGRLIRTTSCVEKENGLELIVIDRAHVDDLGMNVKRRSL